MTETVKTREIRAALSDDHASDWLKNALRAALRLEPEEAAAESYRLACLLDQRWKRGRAP